MVGEPVKCESSCKLARLATTVVPTLHAFSRLRDVLGGKTLGLRANGDGRLHIYDCDREAWDLLREPAGLEILWGAAAWLDGRAGRPYAGGGARATLTSLWGVDVLENFFALAVAI